jgi:hypothetical protein
MEMSPGNFLCSYLKNAIVFLYKIGEQEGKTDPVVVVGVWYQWEGEGGGERVWEGEMVQILGTHVGIWKYEIC